jgi:thiamine-phosphate pyrophosphorylase
MDKLLNAIKLCLVTNITHQPLPTYTKMIEESIKGGVTMVQLREKPSWLIKHQAKEIQKVTKWYGTPLIINDDVELAAEIDADGVHLGPHDMHPDKARSLLGSSKIIGLSIETLEELEQSQKLTSIDYITASAVFPSKTKPQCRTLWGINGLTQLNKNSKFPVTGIGGITEKNVREIMITGIKGIAVIGAIHDVSNPYLASQKLREIIEEIREEK